MTKAQKKSVKLLKEIYKLANEYSKLTAGFSEKENKLQIEQALVIGIWHQAEDEFIVIRSGHSILCEGLLRILEKESKPSLAEMVGL